MIKLRHRLWNLDEGLGCRFNVYPFEIVENITVVKDWRDNRRKKLSDIYSGKIHDGIALSDTRQPGRSGVAEALDTISDLYNVGSQNMLM